jgi:LysR family hydrogen peroxide-inducible transcriptional activator
MCRDCRPVLTGFLAGFRNARNRRPRDRNSRGHGFRVTQPTLSAGIQELERTLGAGVVDRARSGVILTAVGEEALRRATVILNEAEELVEAAKNAGQPLAGRFRLGVIPTIAPFLLPSALRLLRERFPKLRLFLREDLTQRLIACLKPGPLDRAPNSFGVIRDP